MSAGADTSVRKHINAKRLEADRKDGCQNAKTEKITAAQPVTSSRLPTRSPFPGEFFNNIGRSEPFAVGGVRQRRVTTYSVEKRLNSIALSMS
jgi:hypothetical protein